MTEPEKGAGTISRREALTMGLAGTGVGVASAVGWSVTRGQRPPAFPPPSDPNFGESPSWTTMLNEVGPNCYTYVLGNGPPHNGHPTRWMELLERILDMDVEHIVPGHGPVSGKEAVQEMLDYFTLLKSEARTRYDAGMSPGRAAAEIRMGKFDNWMGAERIILNLYRFYKEFEGTLDHNLDLPGFRVATAEYNTIVGGTPEASHRIYHFDRTHG